MGPVVLNYIQHHISITYLHTPYWIPYLFVPVGAGMLAIGLLIEVIGKLKKLGR
jgi:TRAP-type C4-dicarboxylate transport system permease small subunit